MNKETSLKKRENSRKSRIALNLFIKKSLKTKGLSSTEINYAVRGKGSEKRLIAINEWTNLPQPEKEEYNQLAEQGNNFFFFFCSTYKYKKTQNFSFFFRTQEKGIIKVSHGTLRQQATLPLRA